MRPDQPNGVASRGRSSAMRRNFRLAAPALLTLLLGPWLIRAWHLVGLPDPGPPPGAAAFGSRTVAEDDKALVEAGLLPELPRDACSPTGAPLRFKREEDRIVIHSVGPNGIDQGGARHAVPSASAPAPDDVGFSIRLDAAPDGRETRR